MPAGSTNGGRSSARGRGVKGGATDGDLLVTVEVEVPTHLSEEKAALADHQAKAGRW